MWARTADEQKYTGNVKQPLQHSGWPCTDLHGINLLTDYNNNIIKDVMSGQKADTCGVNLS